jgi:hypothetical protein
MQETPDAFVVTRHPGHCNRSRLISASSSFGTAPPSHGRHLLFFNPVISPIASGGLQGVEARYVILCKKSKQMMAIFY